MEEAGGSISDLLGKKLKEHNVNVWLVNTGWSGGSYGTGERMKLKYTRAMITAALEGKLNEVEYKTLPVFGLAFPTSCPDVPAELLNPRETWASKEDYDKKANHLAEEFVKNFAQYADGCSAEILAAAPKAEVHA